MSKAFPNARLTAGRLIALETARGEGAGAAVRVCERLRQPLARLAGAAGFQSLLSRALAIARSEVPSLAAVKVRADGSLDGPGDAGPDPGDGITGEGGVAVVAHLLGLLVTFIGEPLTLQLVREVWPDLPAGGADPDAGGES